MQNNTIPSFLTSLPSLNGSVCIVSGLLDWIQRAAGVWQLEGVSRAVKLSTHDDLPSPRNLSLQRFSPFEGRWPPGDFEVTRSAAMSLKSPLSLSRFALTRSLTSLCSCCAKLYSTCHTLKNWQNAFSPPQCHSKYIYIYIHKWIHQKWAVPPCGHKRFLSECWSNGTLK